MSTNAYDSTTGQLDLVAGTPRSRLNTIQAKAEASLNNQSSSIEPSNTAQYSHTAGSFINYGADKQFAEVTSAIAVGDSIVNGTNVEDKSIGEVLTSLNSALNFSKLGTVTMVSTDLQSAFCSRLASLLANRTGLFFTSGSFEFVGEVVNGEYKGSWQRLSGTSYTVDYATNNSYGRASFANAAAVTVANLYTTATGMSRSIDVYFKP